MYPCNVVIQFYFNINKSPWCFNSKVTSGGRGLSPSPLRLRWLPVPLGLGFHLTMCVTVSDLCPLSLPLADLTGSQDDSSLLPIDQGWWWGFPLVFVLNKQTNKQKKIWEWKKAQHLAKKKSCVAAVLCYLHGSDSIHLSTYLPLKVIRQGFERGVEAT